MFSVCHYQAGCGIHYYDRRTGKEHLWGVGHLQMAVHPPAHGLAAVATGNEIAGVRLDAGGQDFGVSLGYESRRRLTVNRTAEGSIIAWPTADFFNFRVGTNLPIRTLWPTTDSLPGQTR